MPELRWVRFRWTQWRRGLLDAGLGASLTFLILQGVMRRLPGGDSNWTFVVVVVCSALVLPLVGVRYLRTGVATNGYWVYVRNPFRSYRLRLSDIVAVADAYSSSGHGNVALITRSRVGLRRRVVLVALPYWALNDPDTWRALPFLELFSTHSAAGFVREPRRRLAGDAADDGVHGEPEASDDDGGFGV